MKKCTITVKDEVYCTIGGLDPQDHAYITEKFSYYVEGYRFMPRFTCGSWDGRIAFFSATGKVYFRLLDQIVPYLEGWNYEIDLVDLRAPVNLIEGRVDTDYFKRNPEVEVPITLRPYQVEGVNKALDTGSGFILAATSAGKTIMIAALCDILNKEGVRCLIIVPSADLVEQTAITLRLTKLDVGTYSGSTKDFNHATVVATWQSLQNNPGLVEQLATRAEFDADGKQIKSANGGALIIDEAHGLRADSIGKLVNEHGKNCPYRFGFTGTMPKPLIDQATLKGSVGEVIYEISASDLMKMGYVAQLEIQPIQIIDDVAEEFPDYASEKAFISKSPKRIDLLADLIISKAEKHGNTLVLVSNIKQGQQLQKLIKDSVFLYGNSDNDVRAEWYSMFAERDDLIVIATYGIASTGISIDRIFALCMIDAGKSYIRAIQTIGRSLRKAIDKNEVTVYDIHSKLKWSRKHFNERNKYYKDAKYRVLPTVKLSV